LACNGGVTFTNDSVFPVLQGYRNALPDSKFQPLDGAAFVRSAATKIGKILEKKIAALRVSFITITFSLTYSWLITQNVD